MLAKQLSRWTMAWFGAAMLFLLLSLTLGVTGLAGPGDWARGSGLAVVHLFTLGWLSLVMMGALIQFVPVLTALQPARTVLSLPALLAAIAGTLALAGGFLSLDGHEVPRDLFLVAPGLLALAFGLVAAMVVPLLVTRASLKLTEVRMVLLALIAFAALWGSGSAMTYILAGIDIAPGFLPGGLPLHIVLGIGGWLSLGAFGVSYKLFPMFLLAPEQGGRLRRAVFLCGGLALGLTLVAVCVLGLGHTPAAALIWALAALLPITAGTYIAEITRIWRLRRRATPEGNMNWSRGALAFLAAASLLGTAALGLGGVWAEAAIFVALAGWLSLLTLAQMVKITSFLTWIQIFAPRIGRSPVPLVHQLTDARANACWLTIWSAGVTGGALSLLLSLPLAFRLSSAALLIAALGMAVELVAIRRLWHLDPSQRPERIPPLILPPIRQKVRP